MTWMTSSTIDSTDWKIDADYGSACDDWPHVHNGDVGDDDSSHDANVSANPLHCPLSADCDASDSSDCDYSNGSS